MTTIKLDPGAALLLDALHGAGHAAYAVGGCVRASPSRSTSGQAQCLNNFTVKKNGSWKNCRSRSQLQVAAEIKLYAGSLASAKAA